jgi:hypothetical protein
MRFLPRPQRGNRPYSHYDQSNPRLASAVRLDPGVLGRLHRAGARDRPLSTLRSIRASSPATIKKKPSATDNRPTSWTPAVVYTSGCSAPTRIGCQAPGSWRIPTAVPPTIAYDWQKNTLMRGGTSSRPLQHCDHRRRQKGHHERLWLFPSCLPTPCASIRLRDYRPARPARVTLVAIHRRGSRPTR